jgi:hypothetical protein
MVSIGASFHQLRRRKAIVAYSPCRTIEKAKPRLLERFRAKHATGLDPVVDAGSREENATKQSRLLLRFKEKQKQSRQPGLN